MQRTASILRRSLTDPPSEGQSPRRRASTLAGLFLGGSIVWILGSDQLVRLLVDDPDSLTAIQSVKGLVYVAGAALFLFVSVKRELVHRRRAEGRLRDALVRQRGMTARLHRLDELKNAFLVAVSHELRTPLSAIIGFTYTLDEHDARLTGEQRATSIVALRRNAERLERHVLRLLDSKRLEVGVGPPSFEPVDLPELVRAAVRSTEAPDHSISVAGGSITVRADPSHIKHLMEELLDNVVRHTPSGTTARVSFSERDGEVELVVEDDGPGIPDDLKEHVFDPFETGEVDPHAPGLGLGLHLVATYARQHGGRAQAEDGAAGGACIRVGLPKEPASPAEPPAPPRGSPEERTSRIERFARLAGLEDPSRITTEGTARRRWEITGLLFATVIAFPATVAATLLGPSPDWIPDGTVPILRVGLVALGIALAGYAVEKERAIGHLGRALAEEQAVRRSLEERLGELLEGGSDEGPISFRHVANEALGFMEADHVSILAVQETDLRVVAEAGKTRGLVGESVSLEEGISGYIARTGRSLLLHDDVDVVEVTANLGQPLPRDRPSPLSAVCVPLRREGIVVAVLNVNVLESARRFDAEDLRRLTVFAEEAGELIADAAFVGVRDEPLGTLTQDTASRVRTIADPRSRPGD